MDVYRIGVSIALSNGVSAGLAAIQRDVLGLHKAIDFTTGGFSRMKVAALGVGAVAIGAGMLVGLNKLADAGEKVTHQLALMKAAGLSAADVGRSLSVAQQTSSAVHTTDILDGLTGIMDLRQALKGDIGEALANLPAIRRAAAVVGSVIGGDKAGEQVYAMAKAAEQLGRTKTPEAFQALIDGMVKATQATNGRVTGTDFQQTATNLRGAGMGLSDEFITQILPTIMAELSRGGRGGSAGVGIASAFSAVIGGRLSEKAAKEFARLNLVDPGGLRTARNGAITGVRAGGITGGSQFEDNPLHWVQKTLMPALAAKGIVDPAKIIQEIAGLFENRTAQQAIDFLALQQPRILGDQKNIVAAQGVNAYGNLSRTDPAMVQTEFAKQAERLAQSLGMLIAPVKTALMARMADAMSYLAGVIEQHPTAARIGLELGAGLGALLVALGTLAIAGAALTALAGGLAALGAAVVPALVIAAGAALVGLAGGVSYLIGSIDAKAVAAWASGVPAAVEAAFKTIGKSILHEIEALPGQIAHLPAELFAPQPNAAANPNARGSRATVQHEAYTSSLPSGPVGAHLQPINLIVDGKKLGQIVTGYQARSADRPATGSSGLTDGRAVTLRPGLVTL